MGDEMMQYVKRYYRFVRDPFVVSYINRVGQQIVREFPSTPFEFNFYVLKEDVYNAFAGPGGHVFINSGLLAAMDNEAQLAGILAHEVSHVFCRHISERMARAKKLSLVQAAGMLAGIFLGGDAGAAAMAGSQAVGQTISLQYSRENETEADTVGIKYLTKAGYGCEGLIEVFGKMRDKRWFGPEDIPDYMSTHPALETRMAYIDTWIQTHPEEARAVRPIDPTDFDKVRTRVIALYGDAYTASKTFSAEIQEDPENAFAYYGQGLLLDRMDREKEAVQYLKGAIQRRPLDPDIYRDLGKTYFHIGDYSNALKILKGVLAYSPKDPEAWFLVGRAQMETGDLQGAVGSFETLMKIAPKNLSAMYYLGEAYGKQGNLEDAHYYLGIYYQRKGEFKNATFHLNRALRLASKDDERKRAIEKALKEVSESQKGGRNGKSA
ncbi:MAG: M48 family metalloprotease [Deltaproteobacteria bacterium]|nr:M48 family metalloprotease [Deltaproteobacteria bacterium]